MTKYVAISLVAILLEHVTAVSPHSSLGQEEDLSAKKNCCKESGWMMRLRAVDAYREGDTIYYADSQSALLHSKSYGILFYSYGNDTTYYKIDKQGEHIFWFHSIADNMIRLHKSEDP